MIIKWANLLKTPHEGEGANFSNIPYMTINRLTFQGLAMTTKAIVKGLTFRGSLESDDERLTL